MRVTAFVRPALAAFLVVAATLTAAADDRDRQKPPDPGPHPGDPVSFCGKVVPLVEAGCIGIVGITSTVELTSVKPRPEVGSTIQGTGTIGGDVSKCMQGVHLGAASYSKADYCAPGP